MDFIWNMRCINLSEKTEIHDKYEVHMGYIFNIIFYKLYKIYRI